MDAGDWLAWYRQANEQQIAFAGQQEYMYPTYSRDKSWLEELTFWNQVVFEEPAPPAGLRPSTERRTYEEEGEPPSTSP